MRDKIIVIVIISVRLLLLGQWNGLSEEERAAAPDEMKACVVGLSVEDFDLFSRTVEAESDRSDNFEGRVLIALVILNRVNDSSFPNSPRGVITQSGQFEVYYTGTIWSTSRTNLSDLAIIEAYNRLESGEAPHVMYFNNTGYQYGEPYCYEGGNYFVTT